MIFSEKNKEMKLKKIIIVIPLLLAGCAKVSDYQDSCENSYSKLSDVANCLDKSVKSDFRMSHADTPKLYVSAAKMLGEAVDQGRMTDAQARYQLQSLYVSIKSHQDAEIRQNMANINNATTSPQQTYINEMNSQNTNKEITAKCTSYGYETTCKSK